MNVAADKAHAAIVDLEVEIARLKREVIELKQQTPPFSHEQASQICSELMKVLTGRTVLPPGSRQWRYAVAPPYSSMRYADYTDLPTHPSYRQIEVRW